MKLALNASSKKVLDAYRKAPVHGLLLTGQEGVGLGSLAAQLAEHIAEHATDITTIVPDGVTIPIERIRTLYEETRSVHKRPQVVILDDADTLSLEAQNALLKLLEEPVRNVFFILTTHTLESLLPTIRSRTQVVTVKQLSREQSETLLDTLRVTDTKKRSQMLFLASGLPAEITRLASGEEYFAEQVAYVEDARSIIQDDLYGRLRTIANYSDRAKALKLISVIGHLVRFSILKQKQLSIVSAVDVLELAGQRITRNGHVRTQLMYLMTKLP